MVNFDILKFTMGFITMNRIHHIAVIMGILSWFLILGAEPVLCLDCSTAVDLGCITYEVVSGDTTGKPDTDDYYYCVPWSETGGEDIYIIHTDITCDIIAVLSMLTVDLDVFILSDCDPSTCLAFGSVSAPAISAPPGTYYIVVEGFEGAEGSYTLSIRSCCGATYTPTHTSTPIPTATYTPTHTSSPLPVAKELPAVYPRGKSCILFFISFICILFLIKSYIPR